MYKTETCYSRKVDLLSPFYSPKILLLPSPEEVGRGSYQFVTGRTYQVCNQLPQSSSSTTHMVLHFHGPDLPPPPRSCPWTGQAILKLTWANFPEGGHLGLTNFPSKGSECVIDHSMSPPPSAPAAPERPPAAAPSPLCLPTTILPSFHLSPSHTLIWSCAAPFCPVSRANRMGGGVARISDPPYPKGCIIFPRPKHASIPSWPPPQTGYALSQFS